MMPEQTYAFNALITRVIDGDTIDCNIDLGLHCHRIERVRLFRVNAPELFGENKAAGMDTKNYVMAWIGDGHVRIQTYKSDAFGRYLAEVWRPSDGANLADDLLATGKAQPYP